MGDFPRVGRAVAVETRKGEWRVCPVGFRESPVREKAAHGDAAEAVLTLGFARSLAAVARLGAIGLQGEACETRETQDEDEDGANPEHVRPFSRNPETETNIRIPRGKGKHATCQGDEGGARTESLAMG